MEKIPFAVVGCGHIGKRHAMLIRQNDEAELKAICDTAPKDSLQLPADLQEVPFFDSIESLLLSNLPVEVVNLCTPNGYHATQALLALDAGKHIVIEKPMALTKTDGEHIIFKALQVHKQVFCVMQNRYSPPAQWLKRLIGAQVLGEIYQVQVNCYWNRDDRYYLPDGRKHPWHGSPDLDGGTLFTQFSHFIDMIYWLFGDMREIKVLSGNFAHAHSTGFEDSGVVLFRLTNSGALGSLSYSTAVWDRNFESSMTIIGSRGTVKIGGQYMDKIDYCHVENYQPEAMPPASPPNDYGGYQGSAANHRFVIQNVIDVLKGRTSITTNALEGLKTVEIIEKIYRQDEFHK